MRSWWEMGFLRDPRSTSLLRLIGMARRVAKKASLCVCRRRDGRARVHDRRRRRSTLMAVVNEARSWVPTNASWSAAARRRHIRYLRASRRTRRGRKSARCWEDVAAASPIHFALWSTSSRSPSCSPRWSTVSVERQHLKKQRRNPTSWFCKCRI